MVNSPHQQTVCEFMQFYTNFGYYQQKKNMQRTIRFV